MKICDFYGALHLLFMLNKNGFLKLCFLQPLLTNYPENKFLLEFYHENCCKEKVKDYKKIAWVKYRTNHCKQVVF